MHNATRPAAALAVVAALVPALWGCSAAEPSAPEAAPAANVGAEARPPAGPAPASPDPVAPRSAAHTAPTPASPSTGATPGAAPITINWVGDMTFGTTTATPPGGAAAVLSSVPASALGGDLTLGNLETALGDGLPLTKCGPGQPNCYEFETPTATAQALAHAGFAAVNVANNHTIDAGHAGEVSTDGALRAAGLGMAGRPGQISYLQRGGHTIALLGFAPYGFTDNALNVDAATAQVREAKAHADLVIVMTHLGAEGDDKTHVRPGHEYYLGEDRGDPSGFAHAVIDAGADLVVGSGPHVLRGMEWYHGHLIAYSLGNFCGYHTLPVTSVTAITGVLHVSLEPSGAFVSGGVTPLRIVAPGTPTPDPHGAAISMINSLSRADFGAAAVAISAGGDIAAPPTGE